MLFKGLPQNRLSSPIYVYTYSCIFICIQIDPQQMNIHQMCTSASGPGRPGARPGAGPLRARAAAGGPHELPKH